MDDYLKEALEIAKAQASVRIMKKEDIAAFVQKVSQGIRAVAEGEQPVVQNKEEMALEGRKFVKEKSVTCLEWNAARTVPGTRHGPWKAVMAGRGSGSERLGSRGGFRWPWARRVRHQNSSHMSFLIRQEYLHFASTKHVHL